MNAGQMMTWADFKLKFSKYHVPQGLIKKMRDEFRELKQGRMSVVEYRDRFLTLSRTENDAHAGFLLGPSPTLATPAARSITSPSCTISITCKHWSSLTFDQKLPCRPWHDTTMPPLSLVTSALQHHVTYSPLDPRHLLDMTMGPDKQGDDHNTHAMPMVTNPWPPMSLFVHTASRRVPLRH
ncbi:hypothetical protein QYE76_011050 [Lolium multiflorum]|uniref:Retrotransposon gag domain-containing protein n=1 Tax=Lolium multiflorum TaxID=4521 RepID=A0AAD8X2G0_LOLMU|nr:hypothetical protein QYE76_011050 [Lolium multiflorum]